MDVIYACTDIGDRAENLDRLGHIDGLHWSVSYVLDGFYPSEPHFVDSLQKSINDSFIPFIKNEIDNDKFITIMSDALANAEGEGKASVGLLGHLFDDVIIMTSGDTRIYFIDEKTRTTDHSKAQEMINSGRSPAASLHIHPYRRYLTKSINEKSDIHDFDIEYKKNEGDVLICSDGFWSSFNSDDEIFSINSKRSSEQCFLKAQKAKPGKADNLTMLYLSQ